MVAAGPADPAGSADRAGSPVESCQRNLGSRNNRSSLGVAGLVGGAARRAVAVSAVAAAPVHDGGQVSVAEVVPGYPFVFGLTRS